MNKMQWEECPWTQQWEVLDHRLRWPRKKYIIFLFIDHPQKKKKIKDYEDGGYTKRYTSYKVGNKELEEWLDKNIKEEKDSKVDKDDILNAITGERFSLTNDEVKFLDKFRIQVTELKRIGEENVSVDIYFDKKKEPSTNDLTVTFLDTEPSKK